MERESFESEEVAALMNKHFINIKVDKEERADVDRVYMTYVQVHNAICRHSMSPLQVCGAGYMHAPAYQPAKLHMGHACSSEPPLQTSLTRSTC